MARRSLPATSKVIRVFIVAFCCLSIGYSADWYSSPSAVLPSSGSFNSPWPLSIALQTNSIQPGDTLYLRSGTYRGPFISSLSGTSNNYVTVRPYASEFVLLTDGASGVLLTNLPNSTANVYGVPIAGTEYWPLTHVQIGNESIYVLSKSGTNYNFERDLGGTTEAHSIGDIVYPKGDILTQNGNYVIFRDFYITSTRSTNRVITATNWILPVGLNMPITGHGNKAVNLVVYNVGHPAIGFWSQGDGGEINGCIFWGNGIYDDDGTWIRGNGVYAQNQTGTVLLKNNIAFRNFTYGMKGYGESGPVKGFIFDHNIAFDSPNAGPLEMSSGSTSMTNNSMFTNFVMGGIAAGYVSKSNVNQSLVGNVIVNGGLGAKEFLSGIYSNNTVFVSSNFTATDGSTINYFATGSATNGNIDMLWDYNRYYFYNASHPHQFAYRTMQFPNSQASDGSGNLKFENDVTNSWKDYSRFDSNSIYTTYWPTQTIVNVTQSDYNSNRFHIVVINTDASKSNTTATIPGVYVGAYTLRDAQNYFVSVDGAFTDGTVTLPLNSTNVSEITGTLTHYTNRHTNVRYPGLFNAFVIDVVPGQQISAHVSSGRFRKSLSR